MRSVILAVCLMFLASTADAQKQQAKVAVKITATNLDYQQGELWIAVSGTATLPNPPGEGGTWCVIVTYQITIDGVVHQFETTSTVELWNAGGNVTWSAWDTGWDLPEGTYTITARLVLGLTPSATDTTTFVVFYG